MDLIQVFDMVQPYKGKTLTDYFGDLLYVNDTELEMEAQNFLKVVATFVYRSFSQRRKGGIPLGYLEKFVFPEDTKLDLTRTMMLHIVRIFRKRGLREYDAAKKSITFQQLVDAYDKTSQRR